jgi:hypothetical protein
MAVMPMPPIRRRVLSALFCAAGAMSLAALTSGCASPPDYTDIAPQQASQWIGQRELNATAPTKMTVSFLTDPTELSIERLGYQVREGNLYLWPERGEQRFEPVAFDLDTKKLGLKQPWRDHVYWLLEDKWDGPLERAAMPTKGQYVRRLQAKVEDGPPPGTATTRPSETAQSASISDPSEPPER